MEINLIHRAHRFDGVISLYEKRLCKKVENDIINQLVAQKVTGKLAEKKAQFFIDCLNKKGINIENGYYGYMSTEGLTDKETKIIETINETTKNSIEVYLNTKEELMYQLDACDEYLQELTMLYAYHILKADGTVEDFKPIPDEEKK